MYKNDPSEEHYERKKRGKIKIQVETSITA
jgi:hypothetical protein